MNVKTNNAFINSKLRPGVERWKYAIGLITVKRNAIHKPEIHNLSQRRQRTTELWPHGICAKIGEDPSSGSGDIPADRHTDRQNDRNTPLPYWGGVMNIMVKYRSVNE